MRLSDDLIERYVEFDVCSDIYWIVRYFWWARLEFSIRNERWRKSGAMNSYGNHVDGARVDKDEGS